MPNLKPNQWQGAYDSGWQDNIVPEAFSHPAKFSRGLIHRIYQHAKEMGWIKPGDYILDPFGGVALGGLDALSMGLNWIGVELEEKFVSLGQQNIELWNRQLKGWPNLGTARIVQGDSRRLKDVLQKNSEKRIDENVTRVETVNNSRYCMEIECIRKNDKELDKKVSDSKANINLIISSPPFCSVVDVGTSDWMAKEKSVGRLKSGTGGDAIKHKNAIKFYGHTPGNLANLKEGSIDAVISSPPYAGSMESEKGGIDWEKAGRIDRTKPSDKRHSVMSNNDSTRYGSSPGQLGSMKEGSFDMCVSSPPYEGCINELGGILIADASRRDNALHGKRLSKKAEERVKGRTISKPSYNNLGNSSGDTFWSASREIVSQCYDLLKPGGKAIWVTKNYVKNKQIVPFSDRWLALNESVGFKLVCRHRAMLVKEHGTQITINGEEKIQTERKSFFRRLAESKGSPRIDWEDILCLVK